MTRTKIDSSQIASLGYDAETQVLEVEFKGGKVYQYFEVPPEKFAELQAAESAGKYLNQHIKGHHDFKLVEADDDIREDSRADAFDDHEIMHTHSVEAGGELSS